MRIAGFSRVGKREPLFAALIFVAIFVGPLAKVLWDLVRGEQAHSVSVILTVVGALFAWMGGRWLWKAWVENCSLEVVEDRLRVNMLFGRALNLGDITGVSWGEMTTNRGRSYLSLRLYLRSGEPCDIPVAYFDGQPDDVVRRILEARAARHPLVQ